MLVVEKGPAYVFGLLGPAACVRVNPLSTVDMRVCERRGNACERRQVCSREAQVVLMES